MVEEEQFDAFVDGFLDSISEDLVRMLVEETVKKDIAQTAARLRQNIFFVIIGVAAGLIASIFVATLQAVGLAPEYWFLISFLAIFNLALALWIVHSKWYWNRVTRYVMKRIDSKGYKPEITEARNKGKGMIKEQLKEQYEKGLRSKIFPEGPKKEGES